MNSSAFRPSRPNVAEFENQDVAFRATNRNRLIQAYDSSRVLILARNKGNHCPRMNSFPAKPFRLHLVPAQEIYPVS